MNHCSIFIRAKKKIYIIISTLTKLLLLHDSGVLLAVVYCKTSPLPFFFADTCDFFARKPTRLVYSVITYTHKSERGEHIVI